MTTYLHEGKYKVGGVIILEGEVKQHGEEFVILSSGMTKDQSTRHVEDIRQLVRNLRIPHSASTVDR